MSRHIQIVRLQPRQFLRKLVFSTNLEDDFRICYRRNTLRQSRDTASPPFRCLPTFLGKCSNQAAAHLVDFCSRNIEARIRLCFVFHYMERCSACFVHLFHNIGIGKPLPLCLFRYRTFRHSFIAVIIESYRPDRFIFPADRVKMYRNTPHFTFPVRTARRCKQLFHIFSRFSAYTEHVALIPVKIPLRKAVTGECVFQHLHLFLCRLAMLFHSPMINIRHNSGVFRTLHPAFYFNTGNPGLFDLIQATDQAVVLQGKRVIIHSPAKAVLHPTGLGTHTAVPASSADKRRHIALP